MSLAMIQLTDENAQAIYLNLDDIMAIVSVIPPEDAPEDYAPRSRIVLRGGFPAVVYGTPEGIVALFQEEPADSASTE